ncbi:MAG TPA: amylo-alpha-1,6-glucosidase, partial [Steroidobacteraceae bacterium]|nr:amylo-alpha-1,6-glucosidase [Steroidobacteraceae bacterium]
LVPTVATAQARTAIEPVPAHTAIEPVPARPVVTLESLAVPVTLAENRAVSFTDKRSAYYYTQTHANDHPEHAWFRGLNVAGRRVFNDCALVLDGEMLDPRTAAVVVRPDAMVRTYPNGVVETLRLLDGIAALDIAIAGPAPLLERMDLRLSGDTLRPTELVAGRQAYESSAPSVPAHVDHVVAGRHGDRFLVVVADTAQAAQASFEQLAPELPRLEAERRARLEGLLNGTGYFASSDATLTQALRWITLTTDSLVTRQRGDGIYAGLPWFNEYWGRDSFIALPGALLVTGHFEQARAVLVSFAQFQDLDPSSRFYGRLPNIVKPASLDYHTTDGTPRWVLALHDYVRYSGDRAVVAELYSNVRASIEGALANWTDSTGLLVHADNETWMDARREGDLVPYSPRGTRANDIQALWHAQLQAGAEFARLVGDATAASRWSRAAERVRQQFARAFVARGSGRIVDRLDAAGRADDSLRPNLFFTLDLLDDRIAAARETRRAWEALVYPWGVATLDARHPLFRPYHLAPGRYHKDEAYHNGTVWPWLDGIALQRVIEFGQVEAAWTLFHANDALALQRGVVGGLPETMDAWPHPGEPRPRSTGTFLQAWSNAEHLRVWYQWFLGVRPDLSRGHVVLAPRLPRAVRDVDFSVRVGAGSLRGRYTTSAEGRRYEYALEATAATVRLDVAPFEIRDFALAAGGRLVALVQGDQLDVQVLSSEAKSNATVKLRVSRERKSTQARFDREFAGLSFASPREIHALPEG